MNALKTLAIALIVGGLLALAYGGFSYTKQTQAVSIGPLHVEVDETKRVNIPLWAGLCAVAIGGVLLLTARRT